jgi:hypothetical protein
LLEFIIHAPIMLMNAPASLIRNTLSLLAFLQISQSPLFLN